MPLLFFGDGALAELDQQMHDEKQAESNQGSGNNGKYVSAYHGLALLYEMPNFRDGNLSRDSGVT